MTKRWTNDTFSVIPPRNKKAPKKNIDADVEIYLANKGTITVLPPEGKLLKKSYNPAAQDIMYSTAQEYNTDHD